MTSKAIVTTQTTAQAAPFGHSTGHAAGRMLGVGAAYGKHGVLTVAGGAGGFATGFLAGVAEGYVETDNRLAAERAARKAALAEAFRERALAEIAARQ